MEKCRSRSVPVEQIALSYFFVVDYFSRFLKFLNLPAPYHLAVLKSAFARHGVPSVLFTDNGPQFSSQDLKEFVSAYSIRHITSNPRYPQSNGLVERTVGTVKNYYSMPLTTACPRFLSFHATPDQRISSTAVWQKVCLNGDETICLIIARCAFLIFLHLVYFLFIL